LLPSRELMHMTYLNSCSLPMNWCTWPISEFLLSSNELMIQMMMSIKIQLESKIMHKLNYCLLSLIKLCSVIQWHEVLSSWITEQFSKWHH
jgi:hypothetical protein